MLKKEIM